MESQNDLDVADIQRLDLHHREDDGLGSNLLAGEAQPRNQQPLRRIHERVDGLSHLSMQCKKRFYLKSSC